MAQETTNATTARAATQRSDGPLTGLILLGTFGSDGAPSALLRLPSGGTATVTTGDRLRGARVTQIAPGVIILTRNGRQRQLRVP